jgi:hypothetical protein
MRNREKNKKAEFKIDGRVILILLFLILVYLYIRSFST